jgi:hypothetical protein
VRKRRKSGCASDEFRSIRFSSSLSQCGIKCMFCRIASSIEPEANAFSGELVCSVDFRVTSDLYRPWARQRFFFTFLRELGAKTTFRSRHRRRGPQGSCPSSS